MYEELRKAFIKRLTMDSPHHDARRKDFNQAIFDADEGALRALTERTSIWSLKSLTPQSET